MLTHSILPFLFQLLLGIKDTDDNLVSATLICLSELVPILGADTVIGGKRSRFFTDGRPNSKTKPLLPTSSQVPENIYPTTKSLRELPCSEDTYEHDSSELAFEKTLTLNERPSPVGGESLEDEIMVSETNIIKAESEDDWSDWDNNRQLSATTMHVPEDIIQEEIIQRDSIETTSPHNANTVPKITTKHIPDSRTTLLQRAAIEAKKNIVDISELDIKNQKYDYSRKSADEFDFFADMMPVIEKPTIVNIAQDTQNVSSKLNFVPDENIDENEAWGEGWND